MIQKTRSASCADKSVNWNQSATPVSKRHLLYNAYAKVMKTSLLNKAGNLKGRLLVIYGGNDPTCVPQHTLTFMRACIDAGTYPDLFTYPGDGHNMFGHDRIHLHEVITRYFEDHLK